MSTGFEVELRGGLEASAAARRAIAANDPTLPESVQDDVALLVTELVTNAVRHGAPEPDSPVQLEFLRDAGRIRVEVVDPGTEFTVPPRQPVDATSAGGWGLVLVDRIAESWGICPAPAGTCVWFEMPAPLPA